jgi:short-subunit dehydrogenase
MHRKNPLRNQIVIITGASSGIGALMAQDLAGLGAIPILLATSEQKLMKISASIHGKHEIIKVDVRSAEQVSNAMEFILHTYGKIDILINNAGYGEFASVIDASLEVMEDMMNVNYMGLVRCTKAVLPHMLQNGNGHIVNIASMAGKIGSPKSSGYSATKHAVLGFTNSLRQELIGTGVTITAVNPGPIDTPFFERADPSGSYVKKIGWFILKPEQVSRVIIRDAILRHKMEINLPLSAGLGVKLYQLFPRLFDRIAYRLLNKK